MQDEDKYEEGPGKLELCKFDDDLPHLTEAEIREKKHSFEWYYFDVDTGNKKEELTVRYIIKDTSIHNRNPGIEFILKKNNKEIVTRIKNYSRGEYKEPVEMDNKEGVIIEIGPNLLKIYRDQDDNIKKYTLILKFDEIEMNLDCTPMHQGFKLSENRSYINKESDDIYSSAVFPAPRMTGSGEIILDKDNQIKIEGEGYHDHPWGTTCLMYSHKEWHWGRIYTDEFTVFFTNVIPSYGFSGRLKFLYFAKVGSTIPKLTNDLSITTSNWKREKNIIFKFPRDLLVTCLLHGESGLKRKLSLKTSFMNTIMFLQIYIRYKVFAELKEENNDKLTGYGWVEYFKVPYLLRDILMFLMKLKYNSKTWRKMKG
ncbi:MAG: hypothetical protein HON76_07235 [Candidatus Scalindua sp.]|nr:hypothetical protein [Candidatus Scalindua sp.]MBT5307146.1 hypothetical protein [Candidatus Scalindua sp.]MBT6045572.1 hypothetical protein [Candidatus Scalindua sp.]MBT6225718.1 hypothetical protein [Candidatus Scalindua sp.]MBT6562303.1 hypothetical protein [Candidatus Scalindua sp.]